MPDAVKKKLRVLDLFSGIGGFSLGLERTGGFETVAFCEIEKFPRSILRKHWPDVPCYADVTELTRDVLDNDSITVDVITGGFPCQDISVAGRQAGIGEGTRSGLWSEIARLVGELRPEYVIVENVAALLAGPKSKPGGWFGRILGDLAERGYDAEWENIPAAAMGASHRRERIWLVAYTQREGRQRLISHNGLFGRQTAKYAFAGDGSAPRGSALVSSLLPLRTGDGVSLALDRLKLKACGNAVFPPIPELIGRAILMHEAGL